MSVVKAYPVGPVPCNLNCVEFTIKSGKQAREHVTTHAQYKDGKMAAMC